MVNIDSVKLIEFKVITHDKTDTPSINFLPDKSMYSGIDKKNITFAILKYGGRIGEYIVLAAFKIIYTSDLSRERTVSKLQQFGYDLIDEDFVSKLVKPCLAMPVDIF